MRLTNVDRVERVSPRTGLHLLIETELVKNLETGNFDVVASTRDLPLSMIDKTEISNLHGFTDCELRGGIFIAYRRNVAPGAYKWAADNLCEKIMDLADDAPSVEKLPTMSYLDVPWHEGYRGTDQGTVHD